MNRYRVETTPAAPDGTCRARLVLPTGGTCPWYGPVPTGAVESLHAQAELMTVAFQLGLQMAEDHEPSDVVPTVTRADVERVSRLYLRLLSRLAAACVLGLIVLSFGLADLYRQRCGGPAVWALWTALAVDLAAIALLLVARLALMATAARYGEVRQ